MDSRAHEPRVQVSLILPCKTKTQSQLENQQLMVWDHPKSLPFHLRLAASASSQSPNSRPRSSGSSSWVLWLLHQDNTPAEAPKETWKKLAPLFPAKAYRIRFPLTHWSCSTLQSADRRGLLFPMCKDAASFSPPNLHPRLPFTLPQLPHPAKNLAEIHLAGGQHFPTAKGSPRGSLRSHNRLEKEQEEAQAGES